MDDKEFLEFRNTLDRLSGFGAIHAIFPKSSEKKIRDAIEARYNDVPKDLTLCNIQLVFI